MCKSVVKGGRPVAWHCVCRGAFTSSLTSRAIPNGMPCSAQCQFWEILDTIVYFCMPWRSAQVHSQGCLAMSVTHPTSAARLPVCYSGLWFVQPLLSSSYGGFGTSSLVQDSQELHELLSFLGASTPIRRVVFVGHSTGCQVRARARVLCVCVCVCACMCA